MLSIIIETHLGFSNNGEVSNLLQGCWILKVIQVSCPQFQLAEIWKKSKSGPQSEKNPNK